MTDAVEEMVSDSIYRIAVPGGWLYRWGSAGVCFVPEPKTKAVRNSRFTKPGLEEVRAYIAGRNYDVDPLKFYNHYEANGWMVGRNKMKDWKAAVRTWSNRDAKTQDFADVL